MGGLRTGQHDYIKKMAGKNDRWAGYVPDNMIILKKWREKMIGGRVTYRLYILWVDWLRAGYIYCGRIGYVPVIYIVGGLVTCRLYIYWVDWLRAGYIYCG